MGAYRAIFGWILALHSVAWGFRDYHPPAPAYVTINVEETRNQKSKTNVLPFVTQGTFSTIGTLEDTEGRLCLIDKDFFLHFHKSQKKKDWIGFIHEVEEADDNGLDDSRDNRGNKQTSKQEGHGPDKRRSLTEKMKDILLLGASALIIVVKNVRIRKEFDVAEVFTKPIIFIHGVENVTKILQLFSLRYDIFAKIQKNFPYYSVAGTIGTITLWSTCGRSTSGAYHEWQGVVCIGNSHLSSKAMNDYFITMAWNFSFLFFICFVVYVYATLTRNGLDVIADLDNEVDNQGLARHVLSQMRIEIYRARGRTSRKKTKKSFFDKNSSIKKFENSPDQCVICLDSFFPLQRLRVLPCNHSFHLPCIDRWLLAQHTCPMCKFNILDHHRLAETESRGNI